MLLSALLAMAAPVQAAAPAITNEGPLSSDTGQMLVEWEGEGPVALEIAEREDFADARVAYEGINHAYFLSGLAGGDYYLRLKTPAGAASEPVQLTVAHQSLERAIWLTIIGAIITLGVIATIVRGARDE